MGSPNFLVTLHSLEAKVGADLYLEVKLAGVWVRVTEGSMQLRTLRFSSTGRKWKREEINGRVREVLGKELM